jgi:MFS family permease
MVQSIYPDEQRGVAMSRVRMMANLVGIGSTLAGGAFLMVDDPRAVLALATLVSFGAPFFFLFMRYDHVARPVMLSPIRLGSLAVRDTAFRNYLIATTFIGFGNAMGGTVYPILLVDRFNAPATLVGLMAATQAVATIAGFQFWGRRIDRGSSVVLLRSNALVMMLLPLTYLVAPNAIFLLVGSVVAGVTAAMMELSFFTSIIELAGTRVEQYMAAQSFILGVRATLAPFVACALMLALGTPLTLVAVVACLAIGAYLARGVRAAARTERLSHQHSSEAFAD